MKKEREELTDAINEKTRKTGDEDVGKRMHGGNKGMGGEEKEKGRREHRGNMADSRRDKVKER